MQIERTISGDLLELNIAGALDNESSRHFQQTIDDSVREGWHRILVDMSGVNYLSSAGIGALLNAQKQLAHLKGFFGIAHLTPEVTQVLTLTRLLDSLQCDPERARREENVGSRTLSMNARIAVEEGLDLQVYTFEGNHSLTCQAIGTPEPLAASVFTESDCRSETFSAESFGIGLGALGESFRLTRTRFGEFLSVMGAMAQSGKDLPDYSLAQGDYYPPVQMLYGLKCSGDFSHLIRFSPLELDERIGFSRLIHQGLKQSGSQTAGLVILAESVGLVGAKLRQSPAETVEGQRFDFPAVRHWLSFSPERIYSRHLALITGVARFKDSPRASNEFDGMLRPIDRDGAILGHFHAAVFPYRPLKKRTLELDATVRELFGSGGILDVLHLLRDDRETLGIGETELLSGACWVSGIREIS